MSTEVQGEKINFPICIAPTAMQKMAHEDGEIGTAKGMAAALRLMLIFNKNISLDVAEVLAF